MWYFQKKGRTEGPIPEATLHLAIQKGDIGALDLLFQEGDSRWRSAYEYDGLQKYFGQRAGQANEDHWIILSRIKGSKENKQRGPYRTSEVKAKLLGGELKYTDYAWKEGMKEWYRITALEIFHGESRPTAKEDLISRTPELPNEDLLHKVETLARSPIPQPEVRPSEARGPDLTKIKATIKSEPGAATSTVKTKPKTSDKKKSAPVTGRSLSLFDRFQEMSPSKKWFVGVACLIVALLTALGSLFFFSYRDHRQLLNRTGQKLRPPTAIETPALEAVAAPEIMFPPVAIETPPPPQVPAQPEAPKVNPSYLKLKVAGDTTESPMLDVQTDASFHYPIILTVTGEVGEVVGARSYHRVAKVADSEKRKYELRNLGLRPGRYRLQVKVGEFESGANVAVATTTKTYRGDLASYRKSVSYFATNERIQLIKLSERLDKHSQDFISQFRISAQDTDATVKWSRAWQKKLDTISSQTLKTIGPRTRNQYVYGEYWAELKELRAEIRKSSMKTVQAKSIGTPEWQEFTRVAQSIRGFREKMLAASLWK